MEIPTPPETPPKPQTIAPVWHTLALISLLLGLSWWGARRQSFTPLPVSPQPHGHIFGYIFVIIMEWLMVLFVWYGLRLRKIPFRELFGSRKMSARGVFRDLGIAALFLLGSNIVLGIIVHILGAKRTQAMEKLVPHGKAEIVLYLLVAISAGICEEIVCRGYLQKQLFGLVKSESGAILLQGLVFGAAHGYQGIKFMVVISVYGCLFGLLAQWRSSLYPGMMAHAMQDSLAGLLGGHGAKKALLLVRLIWF